MSAVLADVQTRYESKEAGWRASLHLSATYPGISDIIYRCKATFRASNLYTPSRSTRLLHPILSLYAHRRLSIQLLLVLVLAFRRHGRGCECARRCCGGCVGRALGYLRYALVSTSNCGWSDENTLYLLCSYLRPRSRLDMRCYPKGARTAPVRPRRPPYWASGRRMSPRKWCVHSGTDPLCSCLTRV